MFNCRGFALSLYPAGYIFLRFFFKGIYTPIIDDYVIMMMMMVVMVT